MLCVSDLACISLPRALSQFIVLLSTSHCSGVCGKYGLAYMAWLEGFHEH